MTPSDILSHEIDVINGMLEILCVMHQDLSQNKPVNLRDLKKVINFFRVYVHQSHNKKEQDILFPELEKYGISQNDGIIKDMVSENQLAEFYISALMKLLKDVENEPVHAKGKLVSLMEKYLTLEKNHLHKEQFFILPLCKQEVPEDKKDRLATEFNLSDESEFGAGMTAKFHDACEQLMNTMKTCYLHPH